VSQPSTPSPLLDLPGAVAGEGDDAGVAAHYGSFNGEQRTLTGGDGFVDLSHRGVVRVEGPDRLTWLHSLTTQQLEGLAPGEPVVTLVLSPQGHVEHALYGVDDGTAFTAHVEPGTAPDLVQWLDRMRFLMRVEVTDVTADLAVAWRPGAGGRHDLVPRDQLPAYAEAAGPACGTWAHEALRIARGEPRLGHDTDHRTIPNEVGWVGPGPHSAVHLDKGCYRGQETVARVHNLGKPPRMLVLLHLDGSTDRPATGDPVLAGGRAVGRVGTVVDHVDLGPVALALLKRGLPADTALTTGGEVEVPAVIDADTLPAADTTGAGRLAVERLRGGTR
jgi:tRNA-modifying protein YgfZ